MEGGGLDACGSDRHTVDLSASRLVTLPALVYDDGSYRLPEQGRSSKGRTRWSTARQR